MTLTVLTYNIHHGEGTDEVFDLERIADVILKSDADLVALQEVDVGTLRSGMVDQAAELARLTGMHYVFGEAIPYSKGSYGDAVLSRYPIEESHIWKLPAEPGHEERVAVAVHITLDSGEEVRFISTHFDHTPDPSDRIRQTKTLLDLAFPSGSTPPPTLLLGDLNAEPGSEPLNILTNFFDSADPDGIPTYSTTAPRKTIDWILTSPQGDWHVFEVGTMDERVASDHLPLRAVLQYKPTR